MDSRNLPLIITKRKSRAKCPTIIQQAPEPLRPRKPFFISVSTFEFYRFRFHFRALDAVHFPPGKSANVVRGSFGMLLRDTAPPAVYTRLFEPGAALGKAPTG